MPSVRYINVAVDGPLRRTFCYAFPSDADDLVPGQRLLVPFGRGRTIGYYLGFAEAPSGFAAKAISRVLDEVCYFPPDLFHLCLWMADYYFANPAECLACALPPALKSAATARYRWSEAPAHVPFDIAVLIKPGKPVSQSALKQLHALGQDTFRKLLIDQVLIEDWSLPDILDKKQVSGFRLTGNGDISTLAKRVAPPAPFDGEKSRAELKLLGWTDHFLRRALALQLIEPVYSEDAHLLDFIKPRPEVAGIKLNEEQSRVVQTVSGSLADGFKTFLLHGITGSGKTIVYCHLARELLARGKTVLVLTPEIALSGATLAYFRGFFGDLVTVIHSAMTDRERLDSWQGIRQGRYKIAVGPRSAIFAPLPDIGLIIVDEEHDGSYKQDDPAPRFHGRDSAIMRAKINNVPALLGSASPSVESYYHARNGRYHLLELTQRPGDAVLPNVRVIDMRTEGAKGDMPFVSLTLKKEIERRVAADEQVILFLNRRGYAPMLRCGDCGYTPTCPQCQVRLTYHKVGSKLTCHYCGFIRLQYDTCEVCAGRRILYMGAGTQKVEEALPKLFEFARTIRLDSDSASGRQNAHRILTSFAQREYNLLLGTQMVTKGLDMPHVSLVGVLSADIGADLPDFRASEKTFARLLQVAGRSGRAEKRGEVILQTFSPDSELITDAARQDYKSFFAREVASRKESYYPPFVRLTNIILSGAKEDQLEQVALDFCQRLKEEARTAKIEIQILGPAPCPLYFLRKNFRRHIIIKTNQQVAFARMLSSWESREARFKLPAALKVTIDIDPDDMM